jgi:membrane protein DedA with SNARE-associated domain
MIASLIRYLPVFLIGAACAAEPQDLPPQAGTATVVIFLVLFFGMCVGFFVYLWWREKKRKEEAGESKN